MGKITNKMVKKSYRTGKKIYNNKLSFQDGSKKLIKIGMNDTPADFYINNYANLVEGKTFTRTMNAYGIDYYLQEISRENGENILQNALLSFSQHIGYYEGKSGSKARKYRMVYEKYFGILNNSAMPTIYPDEVDIDTEYAEGKTKQVLVNSYERNPIARKKCIEHFGITCQVCGLNFEEVYGDLGKDFIHVHHKIDISTVGNEYSVNPITDLVPVCPNCHAMLHKKKPAYSVEALRKLMS